MKSTVIGIAALLTIVTNARAAVLIGPVVNPANSHSYYLLTQSTWASGESQAIALGGHLATINDAAEQTFVFSQFGAFGAQQRLLWIGLTDAAVEGQYAWISGDPVTYTNWAPGEPNDVNGNEDVIAIYYPNHSAAGKWNDWGDRMSDPIGLPFNAVVEVVPEPTVTAVVAALAILGTARLRRIKSTDVGSSVKRRS